ncbi:MAG: DUF454 family protein [Proteobacteria bacterium]|nr:DUF454 family protein [Pseudomonadota bacterium]
MRRFLLALAGLGFTALGFVGLLVPILPGFLFFILAAFCFASAFKVVERHVERHHLLGPARRRWDSASAWPLLDRIRLAFWLTADTMVKMFKGSARR